MADLVTRIRLELSTGAAKAQLEDLSAKLQVLKRQLSEPTSAAALTSLKSQINGVAESLANASRAALGTRSDAAIRNEAAAIRAAVAALRDAGAGPNELARAARVAQTRLEALRQELYGVAAASKQVGADAGASALNFGKLVAAVYAAQQAFQGLRGLVNTGIGLERLQTQFNFAFGAENAQREFAFVRKEANRLGLDINALGESFAKLGIVSSTSGINLEDTRQVFLGISEAAAVMNLSADATRGAFLAVQQIFSKGKVASEEFRQQLQERLPIALAAGARAFNLSTKEFVKELDAGRLSAETFAKNFGPALREIVASGVEDATKTVRAQLQRVNNQFIEFQRLIAESGFFEELAKQIDDLLASLQKAADDGSLQEFAKETAELLADLTKLFGGLISLVGQFREAIVLAVEAIAITKIASTLGAFKLIEAGLIAWKTRAEAALVAQQALNLAGAGAAATAGAGAAGAAGAAAGAAARTRASITAGFGDIASGLGLAAAGGAAAKAAPQVGLLAKTFGALRAAMSALTPVAVVLAGVFAVIGLSRWRDSLNKDRDELRELRGEVEETRREFANYKEQIEDNTPGENFFVRTREEVEALTKAQREQYKAQLEAGRDAALNNITASVLDNNETLRKHYEERAKVAVKALNELKKSNDAFADDERRHAQIVAAVRKGMLAELTDHYIKTKAQHKQAVSDLEKAKNDTEKIARAFAEIQRNIADPSRDARIRGNALQKELAAAQERERAQQEPEREGPRIAVSTGNIRSSKAIQAEIDANNEKAQVNATALNTLIAKLQAANAKAQETGNKLDVQNAIDAQEALQSALTQAAGEDNLSAQVLGFFAKMGAKLAEESAKIQEGAAEDQVAKLGLQLETIKAQVDTLQKTQVELTPFVDPTNIDLVRQTFEEALRNIPVSFASPQIEKAQTDLGIQPTPALADGGIRLGRGHDRSDNLLTWLSPGEYVVRAKAVRALGLQRLHEINRGRIPRFADGGGVALPRGAASIMAPASSTAAVHLHIGGKEFVLQTASQTAASIRREIGAEALKRGTT